MGINIFLAILGITAFSTVFTVLIVQLRKDVRKNKKSGTYAVKKDENNYTFYKNQKLDGIAKYKRGNPFEDGLKKSSDRDIKNLFKYSLELICFAL